MEDPAAAAAADFKISDGTFHKQRFPRFRRPQEVAYFSLDGGGNFTLDRSMLRRCVCPAAGTPVLYDLNADYDAAAAAAHNQRQQQQQKPQRQAEAAAKADGGDMQPPAQSSADGGVERSTAAAAAAVTVKRCMDDLLRCVAANEGLLKMQRPDFVCWRSVLKSVACSPYERCESWRVAARLAAGSVYMCEFPFNTVRYPNRHLVRHWGYKFEQYVTSLTSSPNGSDHGVGDGGPIAGGGAFYSIVSSRLNEHSLLYGAEVDCYRGDGGGDVAEGSDTSHYVELKTNKIFQHPGQERTFRKHKIINWWVQAFLLGASTTVCGFRDDAGVVRHVGEFKTSNVPDAVRRERDMWSPAVCFNFLDDFLSHVKRSMASSSEEIVHVFEFTPGRMAIREKTYRVDDCPYKFMPDWYLEQLPRGQ